MVVRECRTTIMYKTMEDIILHILFIDQVQDYEFWLEASLWMM